MTTSPVSTNARRRWVGALALGLALVGAPAARAASAPRHPLDPLTGEEIQAAVAALQRAGKVGASARFPLVQLAEPAKDRVMGFRPGAPLERRAAVVAYDGKRTFQAEVDVARGRVTRFREVPGVQPPILAEDFSTAYGATVSDPAFQAALARRGITDTSGLICLPLSAGYDGVAEEEGRRLLRVTCLDSSGGANAWARPVENLHAVVDLDEKRVLRVVDSGVTPMSTAPAVYPAPETRAAPRPLVVSQPEGPDARVDGNVVRWDKWQFHARVEQREGLVVSAVTWDDAGQKRPVLYRGALGEIFVPYADASSNWYYRTYMDEGEYGFGKSVQSLQPGIDCPQNAQYLDAVLGDDLGGAYQVPRALCLFERTPGMAVRHFDLFTGQTMARSGRELVLRFTTIVGNYDYMLEWVFKQDGSLQVRAGAGGVMAAKGVHARTAQDDRRGELAYGPLIDERLAATMHQHYFNLRLDLDVDGTDNTLVALERRMVKNPFGTPRRTAWVLEAHPMDKEGVVADDHGHPTLLVTSAQKRNALGYPTAYQVETHGTEPLLMSDEDSASQRAAFARHGTWLTRYNPAELYSAGDFPNQSKGGDGLPAYVADAGGTRGKDLVVWVNLGLGHVPRAEEWPVMPTEWFGSVELKPFNFFDRNPALDLSPAP